MLINSVPVEIGLLLVEEGEEEGMYIVSEGEEERQSCRTESRD